MIALVRNVVALGLAALLTWWLLFHAPLVHATGGAPSSADRGGEPMELRPVIEEIVRVASSTSESEVIQEAEPPQDSDEPEEVEDVQPPPPEAGSRTGDEDGSLAERPEELAEETTDSPDSAAEPTEAAVPTPAATGRSVQDMAEDEALLDIARDELAGRAAVGFATVFISRPEDQLAIARAFGEDVVLVPRDALDPDDAKAVSYRLELDSSRPRPRVATIEGRPPLERYRQYRDLFAYDFARLPEPMRALRRAVVRRDRVFLFAALIPPAEWAVVVGRRRAALEALRLDEQDVERFVMRYVRQRDGGFDIRVDEIILADGSHHRPGL